MYTKNMEYNPATPSLPETPKYSLNTHHFGDIINGLLKYELKLNNRTLLNLQEGDNIRIWDAEVPSNDVFCNVNSIHNFNDFESLLIHIESLPDSNKDHLLKVYNNLLKHLGNSSRISFILIGFEPLPTYILVDGMDLAGKTSVVKKFSEIDIRRWESRYNSILVDNPVYRLARSLIDEPHDPDELDDLFVKAVEYDVNNFKRPNVPTIQEKTLLLKTYVSMKMLFGNEKCALLLEDFFLQHPIFDRSFIITANHEARLNRLQKRMSESPEEIDPNDLLVRDDPEKFFKIEKFLIDLSVRLFNSIVIDTTNLTIDEAANMIRKNI